MGYGKPYTQLYYHALWATYDRLPLIPPAVEPRLYKAMWGKLCALGCRPIEIGGMEDHVHCVFMAPPTLAVADIVQQVKGASSHLMNFEVGERDSFRWQGCYSAFTVNKNAVPKVRDYIQNQKEHHAAGTIWPDWERTAE